MNDDYIENVLSVSVIESIIYDNTNLIKKYAKEKTSNIIQNFIKQENSKKNKMFGLTIYTRLASENKLLISWIIALIIFVLILYLLYTFYFDIANKYSPSLCALFGVVSYYILCNSELKFKDMKFKKYKVINLTDKNKINAIKDKIAIVFYGYQNPEKLYEYLYNEGMIKNSIKNKIL